MRLTLGVMKVNLLLVLLFALVFNWPIFLHFYTILTKLEHVKTGFALSIPFVLLAAACYAKASPRLHAWLLNHRLTGPMLRDWEANRSLTRRTKTIAVVSMLVMVSFSIWSFRHRWIAQVVLVVLGAVGAWVVLRIPTRKP